MYSMILARESGDEYSIRSCKIHCENPVFQRSIDLVAILGFSCRNRHSPLCTFRLFLCHILFCSTNISHSKRIVLVILSFWKIEFDLPPLNIFSYGYIAVFEDISFFFLPSRWWQNFLQGKFKVKRRILGIYLLFEIDSRKDSFRKKIIFVHMR